MADSAPLAGRCIVVTRPAQQAGALLEALGAAGAAPLFFPVIEIAPLIDVSPLHALTEALDEYDFAFFVSANAVEQALAVIPRERWPATLRIVTVGPGSARTLHAHGFDEVMLPATQFDSEGVLALSAMQTEFVAGKRVLILRGDGGRELLACTLAERGARVDVLSCYRRQRADSDASALLARFAAGGLDAISFTSSEGARNFVDIVEQSQGGAGKARSMFAALPCFVPHSRIATCLQGLGAQNIVLTPAGDASLIESLGHYFS
ncbi:MAG TPA: uroporphyrinogen-III synthase [Rhodocyclaceae bacterium]|nr:uroporphyrinogen-III synthase [Rhodocyclaceae bacterium]